jgi:hypothetical protein
MGMFSKLADAGTKMVSNEDNYYSKVAYNHIVLYATVINKYIRENPNCELIKLLKEIK